MAKQNRPKISIHGIRRRWLVNSMSVVTMILIAVLVILAVTLRSFYYSSMTENLSSEASKTAAEFNQYTRTAYRTAAQAAVAEFEYSNLEIQFIEQSGAVLYTSYGVTSGTIPGTPDVTEAIEGRLTTVWTGRDPQTGERIMAVSAPVIYQGNYVVGAVRLVTSMVEVDYQIMLVVGASALIAMAILALVYFSNLYFVRSIVEPLASINETARLISDGSYGIQIDKKFDDEIGELTDTINNMSMKIRQAETTQSEFISSVSHELRTPLTAITGWAETLQSGELKNKLDVQKGMDIIVSEAHRLTAMVEELLEFSRMEDGRFTLAVEPLDLKAELEDAVYTYREFFRKEGIVLEYIDSDEDSEISIVGDPHRLRQVFCNLLDNAAKHGGTGERIDVTISEEYGWGIVKIRDYGAGIPVEELPHVKYKFYKGSSKARGSGIGLAVSDEIITRHEGALEIENADGGGCVAIIKLPLEA